jgi:hypothetical protein
MLGGSRVLNCATCMVPALTVVDASSIRTQRVGSSLVGVPAGAAERLPILTLTTSHSKPSRKNWSPILTVAVHGCESRRYIQMPHSYKTGGGWSRVALHGHGQQCTSANQSTAGVHRTTQALSAAGLSWPAFVAQPPGSSATLADAAPFASAPPSPLPHRG